MVEVLTTGPFVENCCLVADSRTKEAIIIDPGDEPARILSKIRELGLTPTLIFATHGHVDHVAAAPAIIDELQLPFAMHLADTDWTDHLREQCQAFGLPPRDGPKVDRPLQGGERLKVGRLEATVLHTPGHTGGGVSLYFAEQGVLFAGDTLFQGSIGRTDLPGGDTDTLLRSIHEQLLSLPDDTRVYTGHGPLTTIGRERRSNPFLSHGLPKHQGARFI
ncbi:MAG: MBL fold metallo-hydrolase [Deltaproteobacteria bacterium]|nr:MBL fold metallo-hydrolase [Deltaproteobacteria bacterium]